VKRRLFITLLGGAFSLWYCRNANVHRAAPFLMRKKR
jgi:hypothetical protein